MQFEIVRIGDRQIQLLGEYFAVLSPDGHYTQMENGLGSVFTSILSPKSRGFPQYYDIPYEITMKHVRCSEGQCRS